MPNIFYFQIVDYDLKVKKVSLLKLLTIMATKVEAEVIPLHNLHELVVEEVEAEEDGWSSIGIDTSRNFFLYF